jgi:hypothetical protein
MIHGFKGKGDALYEESGSTHLLLLRSVWAKAPVYPKISIDSEVLENLEQSHGVDFRSRLGKTIQLRKFPANATPTESDDSGFGWRTFSRVKRCVRADEFSGDLFADSTEAGRGASQSDLRLTISQLV